ncbi:MAG: HEPN domain-containing protein [Nitrospirota bacterium]
MESKSRDNINAAQLLTINEFYDSSASRAYYAAYLAAWYRLSNIGIQPSHKTRKGDYYWRHDLFPEILCDEYKLIGPLQLEKFELLYSRRIKADYYVDKVEKEEADNSIQLASDFISFFLDNKGNPE